MTEDIPTPPRRRRAPFVIGTIVVVLAVLLAVASRITLNYYALSPGQAQAVDPLITVPPGRAHPVHGSILLTDVFLSQVSLLQ